MDGFAKNSFRKKIIVRFLTLYLLITLCSSIVYYYINRQNIRDFTVQYYREMLEQMNAGIDEQVTKMYNLAGVLSGTPTIRDYLKYSIMSLDSNTINEKNLELRRNTDEMVNAFAYYGYPLEHIIFYHPMKGYSHYAFAKGSLPIGHDYEVRREEWFKSSFSDGMIQWIGVHKSVMENGEDYYFGFAKSVKDFNNNSIHGIIYAAYNIGEIIKNIPQFTGNKIVDYYIVDVNGKILLDKDNSRKYGTLGETGIPPRLLEGEQGINVHKIGERNYIIAHKVSSKSQWKVVGIANVDDLYAPLNKTLAYTIFAIVLSSILFYIMSMILSKGLTRPVRNIVNAIKKVGEGDVEARVGMYSSDELGYIAHALDNMVIQIGQLVNRVKEEERAIKDAEINALQAQINPHFMYNTLNSIKFMAMIKNEENIVNAVSALVSILRRTFNYKKVFVTVQEELDNISQYVVIMKIRYNNKFDIVFDIDEEIRKFRIFKFMLQPIVENSIIHGIAPKNGLGRIHIKGLRSEGNILFEVRDDGVGMTAENVDKMINSRVGNFNSIGIINIDERIKLYFGQEYGVTLESALGDGTRVTVRVPEGQEGEEEVGKVAAGG